jgi:hypothetical protein
VPADPGDAVPLDLVRIDPDRYPPERMPCLRCGDEVSMRFAGPCERCAAQLRALAAGHAPAEVDSTYVPKVNVTANAVALRDD